MTEKDWERFFCLLHMIVDLKGLSVDEKAKEVKRQAEVAEADNDLEEFLAWPWL